MDGQQRNDFLTEHFSLVLEVGRDADDHAGGNGNRIVVLADLNDESGSNFAKSFGESAFDVTIDGDAWAGHFHRRTLAGLLALSWPSAIRVIAALLDEDQDVQYVVLVIAGGGVQLRGIQEAAA